MKKGIIITVSILTLAVFGLAIAGATGWNGRHHTPEEKIEYLKSKITEKLELNATQQTTLDRIAEEMLTEHEQMAGDHKEFKSKIIEILRQEQIEAEELQRLFATKKPMIDNMMHLASGHIAEFHNVLTPEQRETLISEMEAHKSRRCRLFR